MKLGLNRRNAGRFVLLAWAAALAWLARREFGKSEAQTVAEATVRLNPASHFFAIRAAGRQVGFGSLSVDTTSGGVRLTEFLALDVRNTDSTRRLTRTTEIELSRSLRLRRYRTTMAGSGHFNQQEGEVEGDSVLAIREQEVRNGPTSESRIALPGEVILPQVIPYRLAFTDRLRVGTGIRATVFDPGTGQIAQIQVTATAESTFVIPDSTVEDLARRRWYPVTWDTVKAWRIEHHAQGTPVVAWVDDKGGMVVWEAPLGLRYERSAFDLVSRNYRADLKAGTAGPLGTLPGGVSVLESGARPSGATARTYEVAATAREQYSQSPIGWLAGERQRADSNRIRIDPRPAPSDSAPQPEFLAPIPTDDGARPEIRALAARLTAGAASDEERARRLATWVAQSIAPDPADSAPVWPAAVLAARRAGADGHARLWVALAEAAGLAARPVAGVAMLRGGSYAHAWAEVWLGSWVAVDPTFGRFPASTDLLKLRTGSRARALDLLPLIGSASIRPLEPPAAP